MDEHKLETVSFNFAWILIVGIRLIILKASDRKDKAKTWDVIMQF